MLFACAGQTPADKNAKWVHSFAIDGNRHFSDGRIEERLATETTGWWPFAEKKYYDPADFDFDLQRIVAFYREQGFFDAKVVSSEAEPHGDKIDLRVAVDEGEPSKIAGVKVLGLPADIDPKKDTLKLPLKAGDTFTLAVYNQAKADVEAWCQAQGYAYVEVSGEARVDKARHAVEILIKVAPGPLVHIAGTVVKGAAPIAEEDVRERLEYKPGERYDPEKIDDTQAELYKLNVFSSVQLKLPPKPTEQAEITVDLAAGKLHEVRLGGGVGLEQRRQEIHARADWTIQNFLGHLRTLRLSITPAYVFVPAVWAVSRSGVAGDVAARLTQPNLFGAKLDLSVLAAFELGVQEGYNFYGPHGAVGIERPFFHDRLRLGVAYNLQYLSFYNFDPALDPTQRYTPFGRGLGNDYRLAWLEEFAQLDLRLSQVEVRRGGWLEVRSEQGFVGIGSRFTYVKLRPELRGYLPIGPRVVLAARAALGWMRSSPEGGDRPVTRELVLGGPSDHRGFSVARLAPHFRTPKSAGLSAAALGDPHQYNYTDIPEGGYGMALASLEARIHVLQLGGYWLGVNPFVDAGDVTREFRDLNLGALHVAVGAALAYETPIGAVRAGVGVRLNRLRGDGPTGEPNPDPGARFAFHLTIGEAF